MSDRRLLPYNNVPEAMKAYTKLGWVVIPLCSHDHSGMSVHHCKNCNRPGKTPLIKDWRNAPVPDDDTIDDWERLWPSMNVGLVLGFRSGIVAVDVDGEYGEELLQIWSEGDLPKTCEFTTPGGGRRLLYAAPSCTTAAKYAVNQPEKKHEECALLGDGQQTVLPPSRHANGGLYDWKGGKSPWDF